MHYFGLVDRLQMGINWWSGLPFRTKPLWNYELLRFHSHIQKKKRRSCPNWSRGGTLWPQGADFKSPPVNHLNIEIWLVQNTNQSRVRYLRIARFYLISIPICGVVAEWIGHSAFSAVVAGSNPSGSGWDLRP